MVAEALNYCNSNRNYRYRSTEKNLPLVTKVRDISGLNSRARIGKAKDRLPACFVPVNQRHISGLGGLSNRDADRQRGPIQIGSQVWISKV
jgi:hypothetical protein